jgi:hypothetical protein
MLTIKTCHDTSILFKNIFHFHILIVQNDGFQAVGVAQVVESLSSKCEAGSSKHQYHQKKFKYK